jgi:hypothetical protein
LAAEPANLSVVAESETAPAPWRWWWLAIIGASVAIWGLAICAALLLERLS